MSKRSSGLLLAVLMLCAAGLLIWESRTPQKEMYVGQPLLEASIVPVVTQLDFKKGGQTWKVIKNSDGWDVQSTASFPASAKKVIELLDQLHSVKVLRLISKRQEKWKDLDLDGESSLSLSVGQDKKLTLILGKVRQGGGQYIRFQQSSQSYLIGQVIQIGYSDVDWHLKQLLNISSDQVQSVEYKADSRILLSRSKATVEMKADQVELNQELIPHVASELPSILSNLSYIGKLARSSEKGISFKETAMTVVSTFDGLRIKLLKASTKEGEKESHYLRITVEPKDHRMSKLLTNLNSAWDFEVSKETIQKLFRTKDQLFRVKIQHPSSDG